MAVLSTNIGAIETHSWGKGSDFLLLLHASATGPRPLTGLARTLEAPHRKILAPAFSGYGATRPNDAAPRENTALNCAIADAVLSTAGQGQRILFGHSMGGLVALTTALEQTRRALPLDALILYEPILHGFLDPRSPPAAAALAWDRDIIALLARDVQNGAPEQGVRRFVEAWNEADWSSLPESARRQLIANAENLVRETADMPTHCPDLSFFAEFDTPTLLIRGDRSPGFTQLISAHALQTIPGAVEAVLAGCGHMGPLNAPERVAGCIEDFLAAVGLNRASPRLK
jgi:pimeloyl-ACP methyl ester carboxylesterase